MILQCVEMINDLKANIKVDYDEICKAIPEFSRHPLLEFMKMRVVVNSSYFACATPAGKDLCLVPYADFFHPSLSCDAAWDYDTKRKGYVVKARGSIAEGSEVTSFQNVNFRLRSSLAASPTRGTCSPTA